MRLTVAPAEGGGQCSEAAAFLCSRPDDVYYPSPVLGSDGLIQQPLQRFGTKAGGAGPGGKAKTRAVDEKEFDEPEELPR